MAKPRALLVDFDGVLRRWPESDAALEARFGLASGVLRAAAFAPELLTLAITGAITDEQWRERIVAALPRDTRAAEAVAAWSAPNGTIDEGVRGLLAAVSVPVVLVTNATTRLDRDLDAFGVRGLFAAVVSSAAVGAAKPDARIYAHALGTAGVDPADALYVDDSRANVAAARALGIDAHWFGSVDGFRALLLECGLI